MNYSIGIVTYHARFESYFKPLVERLVKIFPDKQIICIANGHPDRELQTNYLRKFTAFLKQFENVTLSTYENNQSLAKCWNELIIASKEEGCLILNDDTQVTELFREEFEKNIISNDFSFSAINGSWSHFFISKDIIRKIGWFDENFTGIGQEDSDYMFRMAILNMETIDTPCLGIKNYVAPAENPSWKEVSEVTDNKYSSSNKEYMKKKYYTTDFNPDMQSFEYTLNWRGGKTGFTPRETGLEVKVYGQEFLGPKDARLNRPLNYKPKISFKITIQRIHYTILSLIKRLYYRITSLYKK
ncbi:MAG: hypothetical protein V4664_00160 [Patescibacteria group bacterium]